MSTSGAVDFGLTHTQSSPAGARRVELSFRDPAYVRAKPLTLIALVLTALVIAVGLVADRRVRA